MKHLLKKKKLDDLPVDIIVLKFPKEKPFYIVFCVQYFILIHTVWFYRNNVTKLLYEQVTKENGTHNGEW